MKTSQKPDEFCGFQRAGVCAQRIHARKREKARRTVPSVVVGAGAVRHRVPSHVRIGAAENPNFDVSKKL